MHRELSVNMYRESQIANNDAKPNRDSTGSFSKGSRASGQPAKTRDSVSFGAPPTELYPEPPRHGDPDIELVPLPPPPPLDDQSRNTPDTPASADGASRLDIPDDGYGI